MSSLLSLCVYYLCGVLKSRAPGQQASVNVKACAIRLSNSGNRHKYKGS